jgi:hypothetical protein
MTEMMSGVENAEGPGPEPEPGLDGLDEQLVEQSWWAGPGPVGCS